VTTRPLRPSRIAELLGDHPYGRDLHVLGIVNSTNDLVRDRARANAPDGFVVTADGQRQGRGRRGTTWTAPPRQAVLLSVLVAPPPEDRRLLAPAAGLAAADALAKVGVEPLLKWPNDVLVNDRKVAGILIELSETDDGAPFAVVGIGVNANQDRKVLPEDTTIPAGSLREVLGKPVDREVLVVDLLRALATRVESARAGDADSIRADWQVRDSLIGKNIVVRAVDRTVVGIVTAIDPVEALTIRTQEGESVTIRAEHAHVLRIG